MSKLQIKKATKSAAKLRMALIGPSGSGKTYTALAVGDGLSADENRPARILVVDTEHGSASKYADIFNFDVVELSEFSPENFIEVIELVNAIPDRERYDVLILDSLSHAWIGKGGLLEQHDMAAKKTQNGFAVWRDVTPLHNQLIEAILQSKVHIIATLRAKTEYVQHKDEKSGRTTIRKVGIAPVQRDGLEYEFDVVGELDWENNFIVGKTRCPSLSGKVFSPAGTNVAELLKIWLRGEKNSPTTVRLPEVMPVVVPEIDEKTDYTGEWNEALNNPQPPRPTSLKEHLMERDELDGKIIGLLKTLNKDEAAFNNWYQKKYDSLVHWKNASPAVKKEIAGILQGCVEARTKAA